MPTPPLSCGPIGYFTARAILRRHQPRLGRARLTLLGPSGCHCLALGVSLER